MLMDWCSGKDGPPLDRRGERLVHRCPSTTSPISLFSSHCGPELAGTWFQGRDPAPVWWEDLQLPSTTSSCPAKSSVSLDLILDSSLSSSLTFSATCVSVLPYNPPLCPSRRGLFPTLPPQSVASESVCASPPAKNENSCFC